MVIIEGGSRPLTCNDVSSLPLTRSIVELWKGNEINDSIKINRLPAKLSMESRKKVSEVSFRRTERNTRVEKSNPRISDWFLASFFNGIRSFFLGGAG